MGALSGPQAFRNPLRSGMQYGTVPAGAIAPREATPLQRGQPYEVVVSRWIGDSVSGGLMAAGSTTFIP